MTEEQIKKVVENHKTIYTLNYVKQIIGAKERIRLSYIEDLGTDARAWEPIPILKLLAIKDIMDKHDKMIRQEIDERIAELEKELEEL